VEYHAFVDMSGGSSDDAVLAIGHLDKGRAVLDLLMNQGPAAPFDPNQAVARFVRALKDYGVSYVTGDRYAGLTFQAQFITAGIPYTVSDKSKSDIYEAFEPRLNARRVLLLDGSPLEQQLLGLVWRGGRIDHQAGEHDDWANAAAGVVSVLPEDLYADDAGPPVPEATVLCNQADFWREMERRRTEPSPPGGWPVMCWGRPPAIERPRRETGKVLVDFDPYALPERRA
jgi:hypothetical protein